MDTTYIYICILLSSQEHLCLFGWWLRQLALFIFLFSDSRIVSYSPFACNWQNKFWDSEPAVARFPRNKGGNSDIWIPHNSSELHLTPCMRDVCHVHGLGPNCISKQNVLSLILLILLMKLTNQKRGIYRHRILYSLQLKPSFPINAEILRFKVVLGPNQMLNWLEKCWNEKYNF